MDEKLWNVVRSFRQMFPDIQWVFLFDDWQCQPVPPSLLSRRAFGGRNEETFFQNVRYISSVPLVDFDGMERSKCAQLDQLVLESSQGNRVAVTKCLQTIQPSDKPTVLCFTNGHSAPSFQDYEAFGFKVPGLSIPDWNANCIVNEPIKARKQDDTIRPANYAKQFWGLITGWDEDCSGTRKRVEIYTT